MKDRLGLAFFTFAAVVSLLAAMERPALLAWLAALHNAVLAVLYSRRWPAQKYDHQGLWLGMLAAMLPMAAPYPASMPLPITIIGILGYGLILWSLLALGNRFGIAPADRGLISSSPYRLVRHPMYLGELVLRAALVATSPQPLIACGMLVALATIQVLRARREERIISGYTAYASQVHYRLIPGVW
jgi:protein-S-isoprenylcysteine O-methyltransferase Ste14